MKHGEKGMVTLLGTDQVIEELTTSAPNAFGAARVVVTDNTEVGAYELSIDAQTAAGLLYKETGARVTLLATSVFPEFRGRGIAGALIGQVLDMLRAEGRTVTLSCPFAMAFVRSHPEYADVVDPAFPGNAHSLGHHGSH
jgi:predicted GNAT family acetyltransferase